ncbi:MAG: ABC transporter ATP-binding protein [Anaerolineales bacterium]
MLEVRDLEVYYGKVYALQGVNLKVERGETVAVLGANGAGKSTLLNTIVGVVQPTSGDILFEGKSIVGQPAHEIRKLGVGYVPEGRRVFSDMTVYENLVIGAYTLKDSEQQEHNLENVYETFPVLKERTRQMAGTLSGGEQQMLAIGRAMMSAPEIMLLDEPSLGLAPLIVQDIFHILQEINDRGVTVLLVEQSANLALKLADRAYVLESGTVTNEGTAEEISRSESVIEAYLGV